MIRSLSKKRSPFAVRKVFFSKSPPKTQFRDLLPLMLPEKKAFILGKTLTLRRGAHHSFLRDFHAFPSSTR